LGDSHPWVSYQRIKRFPKKRLDRRWGGKRARPCGGPGLEVGPQSAKGGSRLQGILCPPNVKGGKKRGNRATQKRVWWGKVKKKGGRPKEKRKKLNILNIGIANQMDVKPH